MCTISTDTIIRANRKTIARDCRTDFSQIDKDGFTVSVQYGGRKYSQWLSYEEISDSYGKALQSFRAE